MRQLTAIACSRAGGAGKDIAPVGLQPCEEIRIRDQSVFGDLGIARTHDAKRQGVEQRRVRDHQDRLMESADQVLAMARVDGGLAADGRIHLRQQRCRHLHIIDAAPHSGGGESGEIADNAAAERHHEIAALDARPNHVLAHTLKHRIAFGSFPGRDDNAAGLDAGLRKRSLCRSQMLLRDNLIGHDSDARTGPQRGNTSAETGQKTAPDNDIVGAPGQCHLDHDRITGADRDGHGWLLRAIEK
jgi:hypothetical protein